MTTDTTQTSPPQAAEEMTQDEKTIATFGAYEYGWRDSDEAGQAAERGLSAEVVANISDMKDESEWMRRRRQKALRLYDKRSEERRVGKEGGPGWRRGAYGSKR